MKCEHDFQPAIMQIVRLETATPWDAKPTNLAAVRHERICIKCGRPEYELEKAYYKRLLYFLWQAFRHDVWTENQGKIVQEVAALWEQKEKQQEAEETWEGSHHPGSRAPWLGPENKE